MKKLFILIIMICVTTLSFAQTKSVKKVTQKQNVEVVLNKQVEILNARIDSMTIAHQEAIETIKQEQKDLYCNYYDQLDRNNNRAWVVLSLIWGAISVILGIAVPLILNNKAEQRVNDSIIELKHQVENDTNDLKQQLRFSLYNNAKAQNSRNRVFSEMLSKKMNEQLEYFANIEKEQKEYVNRIKDEVSTYLTQSKIQSLLSEAQNTLKKSPREAISIYTEILNMDSNHKEALLWRGIAYSNIEDSENALSDLRKLTKLEPRHARAFNNIANVYAKEERDKEALKNYNTALKINPKYAAVYANIAMLYTERGKYHKALEFCDKALSIDYEMIKVHSQKRYIYTQLAKLSKEDSEKQQYINKIEQEGVVIKMLKDKYISELMSL